MIPALAHEYVKRRMIELGYGDKYHMRLRHFVLQGVEKRTEKAYGSYFILVSEPTNVQIKSQNGVFDLDNNNVNEMVYEHHGKITITNTARSIARVRFIQVIPYK